MDVGALTARDGELVLSTGDGRELRSHELAAVQADPRAVLVGLLR